MPNPDAPASLSEIGAAVEFGVRMFRAFAAGRRLTDRIAGLEQNEREVLARLEQLQSETAAQNR
jgi:hypothetical protein